MGYESRQLGRCAGVQGCGPWYRATAMANVWHLQSVRGRAGAAAGFALLLCSVPALAGPTHVPSEPAAAAGILGEKIEGAERLEGRLLAPCCWNQTLDIHGSELSSGLRREIRSRLKAGERPEDVEKSLVARYSARILAVPDSVPLDDFAFALWLLLGIAAAFIATRVLHWRRRRTPAPLAAEALPPTGVLPPEAAPDPLDERLDAELRRLD